MDGGLPRTLEVGRVFQCEHVCRDVDHFHDDVDPRDPDNAFKVTITDEMRKISKYWCRGMYLTERPPTEHAFNWYKLYPCIPDGFYNGHAN